MTNKLSDDQENPFDNILIYIAHYVKSYFKLLNLTANDITTLSLIFGIIAVVMLYKNNYILTCIFYLISYFFDILDGIYAREYNMVSEFGDYYDHIKDVSVNILYFSVLFYKFEKPKNFKPLLVLVISLSFLLMSMNLGCQEKIYHKDDDKKDSLSSLKHLCFKNPEVMIKYTRFFGCGTFIIITIITTLICRHYNYVKQ
jgi:phosphatidylglycerophosphate synthase